MAKAISRRRSGVTEQSIAKTQASVERAIAEAFEPEDVMRAYDMATACRLLAKQVGSSRAVQNKSAAIHTKAVRKIGEVTARMRAEGVLAKAHRPKSVDRVDSSGEVSTETTLTLADLGLSRDIAAAGNKLLAVTPDDIDAMAANATSDGKDFSCKSAVAAIRKKDDEERKASQKEEAIKRRRKVDGLYHGDFREVGDKIPDASVDLIFTDPPYDRKAIELYDGLGKFAARVLRPGGSLIAYVGHIQLPDALHDMSQHLRYWWTCGCFHSDSRVRMTEYGIVVGWKPIVWFVKETRGDKQTFVTDVVTGAREKSHHAWQQAVSEARYFIDLLTEKDGFVVDPFCGGGTTPVACIQSGRKWASFEIDEANIGNASSRIQEALDDQAV